MDTLEGAAARAVGLFPRLASFVGGNFTGRIFQATQRFNSVVFRAKLRDNPVRRDGLIDESHFFNCAVQFRITVIGFDADSGTMLLTRNR